MVRIILPLRCTLSVITVDIPTFFAFHWPVLSFAIFLCPVISWYLLDTAHNWITLKSNLTISNFLNDEFSLLTCIVIINYKSNLYGLIFNILFYTSYLFFISMLLPPLFFLTSWGLHLKVASSLFSEGEGMWSVFILLLVTLDCLLCAWNYFRFWK